MSICSGVNNYCIWVLVLLECETMGCSLSQFYLILVIYLFNTFTAKY